MWLLPAEPPLSVPIDKLAIRIVGLVAVPLAVGMVIRARASGAAAALYKPAMVISTLAFVASVLLSLEQRQDALGALGTGTIAAMLAFVVVLMGVGWLLGGPSPAQRQVLAVTTNLRNVGLVYVLVDGRSEDPAFTASVLAMMALMVPANLVLTIACAVANKRRAD